jgi:electron transport complex protein RnfG
MAGKDASVTKMVLVLTLTCAVMGGALSVVYNQTKAAIENQERLYKLKSIKAVLPEYDNQPDKDAVKIEEVEFYPGKKEGQLKGWAFEWSNPEGYGGQIKILIGLDTQGTITGVEILPGHAETPGLGSRIQEPEFRNQFKNRNLENTDWAVGKDGGDIEAITGATISPRAVTRAVKEGLEFFKEHQQEIYSGGVEE